MTDTEDLTVWLRVQLDEDERIALAAAWGDDATGTTWSLHRGEKYERPLIVVDGYDDGVVIVEPYNADRDDVGRHIIEHDPARVLRAIQAKRTVLTRCERLLATREMTGEIDVAYWLARDVIVQMATEYADRPGCREEWRP